jgi:hypothetical protein
MYRLAKAGKMFSSAEAASDYVSRGAEYDGLLGKTKGRAGRVRLFVAERRILGLPKPHPPLERPFPPEFNRVLYGGGKGAAGGAA